MTTFATRLLPHGSRPALLFQGEPPISYADLDARIAGLSARLSGPKRLVAVEAAPEAPAIVAYLAALRAGHAVALLPPDDPEARAAFSARFEPDLVHARIGGTWRFETCAAASPTPHPDLALLLVTSGSTGQGKAVRLSAAALDANAAAIAEVLALTPADRAALILPLHYSYGLSVLHSHLAAGASVHFPVSGLLAEGFVDGLRTAGCTSLAGVPYSFDLLESIGFREAALPDLRLMTVAGGRLDPDLVRAYDARMRAVGGRFVVMYGQTEATARIAVVPPDCVARFPDRIGVAIPGGALSLIDAGGRPVAGTEVAGELVYRGPNVMMGYAASRSDLARGSEVDALRTGDIAIRDRDGLYRIVGRLNRMSKIAGIRLGHDALEAALIAEGISAAVVGDDRSLLAVCDGAVPIERVRGALAAAANLPLQHVAALAVPSLPRSASGQIDYEPLRLELEHNRPPEAPGGQVAVPEAV
jgi:acyl-CoA synthetase (AMP-forming)/AMP-acid ligase II